MIIQKTINPILSTICHSTSTYLYSQYLWLNWLLMMSWVRLMNTLVITRLAMILHAIVVMIKQPISFRWTVI